MSSEIIKRATLEEKPKIVNFLNENWGSLHPLLNNDAFFNHYYLDGDNINFYFLEEDGEIAAICGYIKSSGSPTSDIWVSVWCAQKGKNGLGLALMGAMQDLTGAKTISCNNIRENTLPFYTFLGYYPHKMQHYYRLRNLPEYHIASICKKDIQSSKKLSGTSLKAFSNINEIKMAFILYDNAAPHKDFWYINRRYFEFPYYNYNIFGIYREEKCVSLVVFRINESDEGCVLRLVDYIGATEDFKLLNGYIDELMTVFDCEYCDMYSFGIDGKDAGFTERDDDDKNIIPNYLNPLCQENTNYYFFTSQKENFTMFKADGDQDRKNLI